MFMFHVALSLELLALIFGAALLAFIMMNDKVKKCWLRFIGYFVVIISLLSIICTITTAIKFWHEDGFEHHKWSKMMHKEMMENRREMMQKRMIEKQNPNDLYRKASK